MQGGDRYAPALALGSVRPLILQGEAHVASWAPRGLHSPSASFYDALATLRADEPAIGQAVAERRFADAALAGRSGVHASRFVGLATIAGRLLAAEGGPSITLLELNGWDTHARQGPMLVWALRELDDGLAGLKLNLADAWAQTVVLVMTEFGRTVRGNGTNGTDHGTGGIAFVLGGCVAGGSVRGDWPGLAHHNLYENRDLQPTTDMRSVAKGLLGPHLGLDGDALSRIFPGSGPIAMHGLLHR